MLSVNVSVFFFSCLHVLIRLLALVRGKSSGRWFSFSARANEVFVAWHAHRIYEAHATKVCNRNAGFKIPLNKVGAHTLALANLTGFHVEVIKIPSIFKLYLFLHKQAISIPSPRR